MYIELFLLDNAMMNLLIFHTAAALCARPPKPLRFLIVSMLGAVYAALAVQAEVLMHPVLKILLGLVMALCLCKRVRREYPAAALSFFLSTFLVGGVAWALAFLLGGEMQNGMLFASIPLRAALAALLAALWLPRTIRLWLRRRNKVGNELQLRLTHQGTERLLNAHIDTGNTLYDPLSGLPVIVVDPKFMPKGTKLWPVPCSTVGGKRTLYACKIDHIHAFVSDWVELSALVAAAPDGLESADALVGSHVFQG
ncbi:MAG: sigma-E processing peptidase SpoIIGA [Bacillota bacterium]